MFEIDRALKIFADRYAADYVHWLLGPDVQPVEKLSGEIPALPRQADIVHRVEDARQRAFIFHLEFQTQRPREPMGRRVLGYNVRLREVYKLPVCSAVVYLLRGADAGDLGRYEQACPLTGKRLIFEYEVARLWEIRGEELLQAGLPGLYPLVGLTKLKEPIEEALRTAVRRIEQEVPDKAQRADMLFGFKTLAALVHPRELLEAIIRKEAIMESPVLKEIWEEALAEGLTKGMVKGIAEGRLKGLVEGELKGQREAVLNILVARFAPPYPVAKELELRLRAVDSLPILQRLVVEAVQAENLESFQALLDEMDIPVPSGS